MYRGIGGKAKTAEAEKKREQQLIGLKNGKHQFLGIKVKRAREERVEIGER